MGKMGIFTTRRPKAEQFKDALDMKSSSYFPGLRLADDTKQKLRIVTLAFNVSMNFYFNKVIVEALIEDYPKATKILKDKIEEEEKYL